jgi:acyl-ACP thioesterase
MLIKVKKNKNECKKYIKMNEKKRKEYKMNKKVVKKGYIITKMNKKRNNSRYLKVIKVIIVGIKK